MARWQLIATLVIIIGLTQSSRSGALIFKLPTCNRQNFVTRRYLHYASSTRPFQQRAFGSKQSFPSSTSLRLFRGIAKSVDREYRREEEQAKLTPLEIIEKARQSPDPIGTIKDYVQQTKDASGDVEHKLQLMNYRSYASTELLDADHVSMAPTLDDLNQKPLEIKEQIWIFPPFRIFVLAGAYLAFPYISAVFKNVETVGSDDFELVTGQLGEGIGVLYGTIVALTLDILYERQSRVQENATCEAGLISQVTQNLISLFETEREMQKEACQLIADQVRMFVRRTRAAELLAIMRADPYAQLLSLVDDFHFQRTEFTMQQESIISTLRDEIPQLMEVRARRLSDEASSLPPTHFLVLSLLTGLILAGYVTATLTIMDESGVPPQESRLVFAALTAVYVLFYNFCNDLNGPFAGVYQIKRSSAASYLLQTKWLISNLPFANEINFEADDEDEIEDVSVNIFSKRDDLDLGKVSSDELDSGEEDNVIIFVTEKDSGEGRKAKETDATDVDILSAALVVKDEMGQNTPHEAASNELALPEVPPTASRLLVDESFSTSIDPLDETIDTVSKGHKENGEVQSSKRNHVTAESVSYFRTLGGFRGSS